MTSSDSQHRQEPGHQLANSLARHLRELNRDVEHLIRDNLQRRGYPDISAVHTAVFANLELGAVRVTELALLGQVSQQAMGKTLKELERLGYLVRGVDASDKRARDISLTAAGNALLAAMVAATAEARAVYAVRLGETELQQLEANLGLACAKLDLGVQSTPYPPPTLDQ